jgi:hypothetical protein
VRFYFLSVRKKAARSAPRYREQAALLVEDRVRIECEDS